MATPSATTHPTLLDFARRENFDGKIAKIIETIAPTNEILEDIPWIEGNLPVGHKTTVRTGYPAATWRLLNYGVQPSKSQTRQVTDTTGMLEDYAEVDKSLADLNGNSPEWRLSEDRAHLIGMSTEFSSTLFYGNAQIDPEKFTGLAPRFSVPAATSDVSGYNLIDGGAADGQTDTLSIWLIGWGENTVHGIYPKGSKAGWTMEDLGQQTLYDAAGGRYEGYRTHYKWDCGISVRDWRYVSRVVNIDSSALTFDGATGAKLTDLMAQAAERVADLNSAKFAWYVPRKIRSFLRRQITAKIANSTLSWDMVAGKHVLSFDGMPVRRVDSLVNETAILDAAGTFADL